MWFRLIRSAFSSQPRLRNYFPLEPILPLELPPQTNNVYQRKLQSSIQKIKNKLVSKGKKKAVEQNNDDYFKRVLDNIMIDKEIGLPLGLHFDDFILDLKMKGHQQSEALYLDNLKQLMKKLQISDPAQLNRLNSKFIIEKTLDNHMAEARQIVFNRLKNFTDADVKEEARKLASERLEYNLKRFDELNKIEPTNSEKWNDQYFQHMVTDTDLSDDEKLAKERLERVGRGDEYSQSYESLMSQGIMNEVQRNYQRNKTTTEMIDTQRKLELSEQDASKLALDQLEADRAARDKRHSDKVKPPNEYEDLLKQDPQETKVINEAKTLNYSIDDEPLYEQIVQHIDYLLLNAPVKLIQEVNNEKLNKLRGYNANFFVQRLAPETYLWHDFARNFDTLFPDIYPINKSTDQEQSNLNLAQQGPPSLSEQTSVTEQQIHQQEFDIELYNELKPQEQFFRHYLDVTTRRKTEQLQKGLEYFNSGLFPLNFENDDKFFDYERKEDQDLENLSEENKSKQLTEDQMENIALEFQEAALLEYKGYGKRKSCLCEVTVRKGHGLVKINGKSIIDYFPHPFFRRISLLPIECSGLACYIDVDVMVQGSGNHSQADAICQGIARALVSMCPGLRDPFFEVDFTRTDTRKVERKKVGLYKARKKYPYSRR